MKFPIMSAHSSLGPTNQQYVMKTMTLKSDGRIMPLAASSVIQKTVAMGKALVVKTGKQYLIESGRLTICSFAGVACIRNDNTIANLFVHHGNNNKDEIKNQIQSQLKSNNINLKETKLRLIQMQTAPSTVHNYPLDSLDTSISTDPERDTDQELRLVLKELGVDNAYGVENCRVKSERAKIQGTTVDVNENGETHYSGAANSCVFM